MITTKSKKSKKSGPRGGAGGVDVAVARARASGRSRPSHIRGEKGVADYIRAVLKPFDPRAEGARIPDHWGYKTTTLKVEAACAVSSVADGSINLFLTACPYFSIMDLAGSGNITGLSHFAGSTNTYWAASDASLGHLASSYRIVGVGWKVQNLLPPTTATGRVIVAPIPVTDLLPPPEFLNGEVMVPYEVLAAATGFNVGGNRLPSSILSMDDSEEVTIQDLIAESLAFSARPLAPSATNWKQLQRTAGWAATLVPCEGAWFDTVTGALDPDAAPASVTDFRGTTAFLLRAEGLPANTACLDIRMVYHIEYCAVPVVSFGAAPTSITATGARKSVVDPIGFQKALTDIAAEPFIELVEAGGTFFGGPAAGKLGGRLARTVMAKLGLTL